MSSNFFRNSFCLKYNVKDIIERDRPQLTVLHMRIAFWIAKTTNTYSEYVILYDFPLQQLLHERTSMLRYTYIASFLISGH
jgi:hypothetical protein